jgi:hypothetical protein
MWLMCLIMLVCCSPLSLRLDYAKPDGGGGSAQVCLHAALKGSFIQGVMPQGKAEFCASGTQRQFKTQVEYVGLSNGTTLQVNLNGKTVGKLVLSFEGELDLNTKDGAIVPSVQTGDKVTVTTSAGTVIETGTF